MEIVDHLRNVVAPHAQRLIDSHFGNDAPRPQVSIPANENEDTDLIVSRGIKGAADEIERLQWELRSYEQLGGDADRYAEMWREENPMIQKEPSK